MVLKIYLIEDHKDRRSKIIKYFTEINNLLKKQNLSKNDKDSLACLQNNGYEEVEVIPILPDEGKETYSNYIFSGRRKWVKEIKNILKKDERRIFFIDLALNSNERALFGSDETVFRAETAMKVLDHISVHTNCCEYIVFESILKNIGIGGCPALDMEKDDKRGNFKYWFMRGNYFVKGQDENEKEFGISVIFDEILKEINNDKI